MGGCVLMSTFTQLKGRIRSDLADRIPVTFLDTELFQFAVEGAGLIHSYIAQAAPSYLGEQTTVSIAEGDSSFAEPANALFIDTLWVKNSAGNYSKFIKTDEKTVMTSLNHSGIPVYWFNFGDTVYFAPKASDDFDIVVFYVPKYVRPTTYDTDFGIGTEFDSMIVEYTIIRAHNRNVRQPIVEQQFFNLKSETLRQILNKRQDARLSLDKTMFNPDYLPRDW